MLLNDESAQGSCPASKGKPMERATLDMQRVDNGYRLEVQQWLDQPLDRVFAFFAEAGNLQTITPDWLSFEIITPVPMQMQVGARIAYRLRVRGISMKWTSLISVWEPPHRFVDEQIKGPYRQWHHEHRFEAVDGRTRVTDIVHYRVPVGALVHWLFVGRDVRRIFEYRIQALDNIFHASPASK